MWVEKRPPSSRTPVADLSKQLGLTFDDPEEYREYARKCLRLADTVETLRGRDSLKQLALTSLRLATNLEETAKAILDRGAKSEA